jgi:hypothetical protein
MDAQLGTPEGDELDVLVDLVELYEARHGLWVIPPHSDDPSTHA